MMEPRVRNLLAMLSGFFLTSLLIYFLLTYASIEIMFAWTTVTMNVLLMAATLFVFFWLGSKRRNGTILAYAAVALFALSSVLALELLALGLLLTIPYVPILITGSGVAIILMSTSKAPSQAKAD